MKSIQEKIPHSSGNRLTEYDYRMLERSWIPSELADAAGIRRVTSLEGGQIIGRNGSGNYEGLIFPYIWPGESAARDYRLRRDHPDLERKPDGAIKEKQKYLSAPGRSNLLYFPCGIDPALLIFDSDVKRNPDVERAQKAIASELSGRGADVLLVNLPDLSNLEKTGADDFLAHPDGGPERMLALIENATRAHPGAASEILTRAGISGLTDRSGIDEVEAALRRLRS
jgi:hypothetical protein